MKNPNKWIYEPNDITILNSALDGLCVRLEMKGELKDSKLIRSAVNALYEMSSQQQHLAVGIEKLKKKLEQ